LRIRAGNDTALPFIAVGWIAGANPTLDRGMMWRSADGDAWEAVDVEGNEEGRIINDVTVFGDQLVAVGGQVHTPAPISRDGTVWASSDHGATYHLLASGLGEAEFTRVSAGGPGLVASMRKDENVDGSFYSSFTMWYSSDGTSWQEAAIDVPIDDLFQPSAIARATDGTLVVATNSVAAAGETWGRPAFLVSADGLGWQVNEPDAPGRVGGVTWTGSQFVATGSEPCADASDTFCGAIWVSSDGRTWQKTGVAETDLMQGLSLGTSALLPPVVVAGSKAGQVGVATWLYLGTPPAPIVANDDPDLTVDARPGSIAAANGIVVMNGYNRSPGTQDSTDYVWTTAP
jgi:hypothetical protein